MASRRAPLIRGRHSGVLHIADGPDTPACGDRRGSGFSPMGRLDLTDQGRGVRGLLATGASPGDLCTGCFSPGLRSVYSGAWRASRGGL